MAIPTAEPAQIEEVHAFWFGEPTTDPAVFRKKLDRWYRGGEAFDAKIRARFGALVERALRGELDGWARSQRGRLALLLLLDQFTRSIYRGSAKSFAGDANALSLAQAALDEPWSFEERQFVLMPFLHAEDVAAQERGFVEMEKHVASAPEVLRPMAAMGLEQSRKYLDVIRRFGRFPHRNEWLGRQSTPEEVEFMKSFVGPPSGMRG